MERYPSRENPRRLLAKLGKMMEMKRLTHHFGIAAADFDKDYEFSDGNSECLSSAEQTTSEDMLNTLCSNMEEGPWESPMATSNYFPGFSPVVVMKNVLVKQPFQLSHSYLVLLHPSVPLPITHHLAGEKKSDPANYLPILNSYTKSAPQDEAHGQKWFRTEMLKEPTQPSLPTLTTGENMLAINGFQHVPINNEKSPGVTPISPTGLLQTLNYISHGTDNPAQFMVQSATCTPASAAEEFSASKNKHFQDTLVVLHRSGLLEVTLKTKEMILQNQMTQTELDQLKQQTQLFMRAIKNNAPLAWVELEAFLMGSDKSDTSLQSSPVI
uniref:CLOCK interacting pacemaker n=1 Tax=Sphenodon punctatus TaxID=8508 RepID=A0A8D0L6N4_SPHPU